MQYDHYELTSYNVKQGKKALLGNTVVQYLEFERHTFTSIIYLGPQLSVSEDCRNGWGLNYFQAKVEVDLFPLMSLMTR